MVQDLSIRKSVRNILLGFALLGLMVSITRNIGGIYWLTTFSHQKYYSIAMLGIWCGAAYLIFNDQFSKTAPRLVRLFAIGRYLTIPILSLLLWWYMLGILITVTMPMVGYRHCDTLSTPTKVYHLDLVKGWDRNYRLTQCNTWRSCKVVAQSVDEDVLNDERLKIEGDFMLATAANRAEPIVWAYDPNGLSVGRVDRLRIKSP